MACSYKWCYVDTQDVTPYPAAQQEIFDFVKLCILINDQEFAMVRIF